MCIYTHVRLLSSTNDSGLKCTRLSSVQFKQMEYRWQSSRISCILAAPDGTKVPWTRNRDNGVWYFNALKTHEDADLTEKEIAKQSVKLTVSVDSELTGIIYLFHSFFSR
jgi:hypothetical protein